MQKSVWIADPDVAFRKVELKGEDQVVMPDGSTKKMPRDEIFQVNPAQFDRANDIAELTFLNEASVVNNLSTRYASDEIYTYSGLFLVAVNPYKQLPIYGPDSISNFKSKTREDTLPHIYAVAEEAYRRMLESRANQSILITGESGAGKTENTKRTIQYLSAITRSTSNTSTEDRILQTNPVLEAFGNAQTVRNNNSSRFGKFIRIEFSRKDTISGASIDWYLLEKSRVIVQSEKERNYHIFYYLLKGADPALRKKLLINETDPDKYSYLCGAATIQDVDDAHEFQQLLKALKTIGFTSEEQELVWSIISAVLHLGNIEVTAQSSDQGRLPNMEQVRKVCKLLGVKEDAFAQILTKPKIRAGRELVQKANSATQIKHSLNSLAMSLYERLFGYIVQRLNTALSTSAKSSNFIGVLDIAGFEIFETNSFEQLCINYTNEKLQQFFNHHMFVLEQAEYVKEEIEWDYVDYGSDLQPTIDLIEKANPMGIFACLDEDCVMPRTTDASFTEKLASKWTQRKEFKPSRLHQGFVVKHYAAEVEYSTDGWLEKNKDPLNEQLTELLGKGNNELAAKLARGSEAAGAAPAAAAVPTAPTPAPAPSASKLRKGMFRTVAQRHRDQLNELMAQLEATHPHFVRCIVPNNSKTPAKFENKLVLDQLRCNGVLEGIRIARSGFPNRVEFDDFRNRYQALLPRRVIGAQETCVALLKHLQLNPSSYKIGTTKVFFKNGVLAELEEHRDRLLATQTLAVQSLARGHLGRQLYKRQLFRQVASKQLGQTARIWLQHRDDPWWKLVQTVRPLLASSESKENNRKDLKIQKLQDHIQRAKAEWDSATAATNAKHASLLKGVEQDRDAQLEAAHKKHAQKLKELMASHAELVQQTRAQATQELAQVKQSHATAIDKINHNLKQAQEASAALHEAHAALQEHHDNYKLKFTTTNKALGETREAHETASRELKELRDQHAKLESSHAESSKHAKTNKQQAQDAQAELAVVAAKLAELESQAKKTIEQSTTSKNQFSQRLNEYVAKLEKAEEDNKKLRKQAIDSDCTSAKFEKQYNELVKAIGNAGLTVDGMQQQVEGLRGLSDQQQATERQREIRDTQMAKALKEAEREAASVKEQLIATQEQLKTAQQQARQQVQLQAQLQATKTEELKAQADASAELEREREQHQKLQKQREREHRHELEQRTEQSQRELDSLRKTLSEQQHEREHEMKSLQATIAALREERQAAEKTPDLAQKYSALQAAHAQLKARTDPAELEASRKECAGLQAQLERLRSQQPQDYELQLQKSRNEKADVMAENSRLLFRRTSGGMPVPDHSAELRKIQTELKVLKLKLVKSERERKMAQANANGLDGVELLKERDAAVRNWEKVKGGSAELVVPKRRALVDIDSNTRINSGAQKVIAELSDNLREEAEAVNLYRKRANDYQLKIEQAQVIMQSLQFSEERLSNEIETLRQQSTLKAKNNDKELDLRNQTIKRLRAEIDAIRDDQGERQALERVSALVSSLNDVTSERDALLAEKIKLEQRLRYEWAGQDPVATRKHELQSDLKQTRRQLDSTMHELDELRINSDLNAAKLDQYEERLRAAEQRNLEQEEELERLRDAGFDANLKLKEANREMAAVREENLRLEKRRQGTYFI